MLALALGLVLASCSGPEGFWRDQYVFVGDDGAVVPLGVLRWSEGHAEVKGWLGQDQHWQTSMHRRFAIAGRDASDLERTLRVFSAQAGPTARLTLNGDPEASGAMSLRIRTSSHDMTLSTDSLHVLGESTDPEGASTYRAGRGRLRSGTTTEAGWIVVESTPRERPKHAFVDYGDYALVLAASHEHGALVLERSLDVRGFDHAFVSDGGHGRHTTSVQADVSADAVRVRLPAFSMDLSMTVADRATSDGVDPDGHAVRYETLLLGGDYAGVALLIHRRSGGRT